MIDRTNAGTIQAIMNDIIVISLLVLLKSFQLLYRSQVITTPTIAVGITMIDHFMTSMIVMNQFIASIFICYLQRIL